MNIQQRDKQLKRDQTIKFITFVSLITLILVLILAVENMLVSCVLAMVITYLFDPIVYFLERRKVEHTSAILLSFLLGTLVLVFLGLIIVPFLSTQIANLKSDLPKYIEGTTHIIEDSEAFLSSWAGAEILSINVHDKVEYFLNKITNSAFVDLPSFVSRSLTTLLLAPFFAFFLLRDGRKTTKAIMSLVPNNVFELTLNLYYQISDQMGQFIRARLLEAGIVGFVVLIGLLIIDFPYASLLAAFAALANLIPYIGPLIGVVPPIIIALINGLPLVDVLLMSSIYFIAQLIDIVFIIPLVVAKLVNLHPVAVVVVIIIGSQVMGVIGMLISIPVASTIKLIVTSVYSHLTQFRHHKY